MRIPKKRPPTHPGEILLKDFLEPLNISQVTLAQEIHVPFQRINELVNGKRGITPSTAIRLSRFFGNSAEFWLNLQQAWEIYRVMKDEGEEVKSIIPIIQMEERLTPLEAHAKNT
jgi:antitoxin HigA-1